METTDNLSFEAALVRLEEIVRQLDQGDLALEDALALFEEGSKLRTLCETQLAEAEATVEQLLAPPVEAEGGAEEPSGASESLCGDDV